ncbi:GtrA family protein [Leifsonia sp. NPDC058248]|uniref:GtrA family protein n=1 Tax=Leifsonia sp. NPDC058248 TaxID=3346402 RepID=UPI0036DCEA65
MAIDTPRTHRSRLLPQLVKFGAVGAVGFAVNFVVFNGLLLTVFSKMHHGTIFATIIATIVAIATNWVGNRYWAFSGQRQTNTAREGVEFFIVSLAGMCIPLLCIWVSHYLLGYTSLLADNISNNVIGLALGTLFRFTFYRWWVFSPQRAKRAVEAGSAATTTTTTTAPVAAQVAKVAKVANLPGAPDRGLVGD